MLTMQKKVLAQFYWIADENGMLPNGTDFSNEVDDDENPKIHVMSIYGGGLRCEACKRLLFNAEDVLKEEFETDERCPCGGHCTYEAVLVWDQPYNQVLSICHAKPTDEVLIDDLELKITGKRWLDHMYKDFLDCPYVYKIGQKFQ